MKNSILYAVILAGLVLSGCASSTRSSNTATNDPYPTPPIDTTTTSTTPRPEITNPSPVPVSSDPSDPAAISPSAPPVTADPGPPPRAPATAYPSSPTTTTPTSVPDYSSTGTRSDTGPSSTSATSIAPDISARMTEWRLTDADIESALNSGVTIVRTKDTKIASPTSAIDDELVKSMINGKLKSDSQTGSAHIEVESKSGEVTLKGSADSVGIIGRAMALALDTQGVTKVSSDLKVSGKTNPN